MQFVAKGKIIRDGFALSEGFFDLGQCPNGVSASVLGNDDGAIKDQAVFVIVNKEDL